MKKTDFAMIILIASISIGAAYGAVSAIPGLKLSDQKVKVKSIDAYTTQLNEPDPTVFNKDAINPTVDVTIGSGTGAQGEIVTSGTSESDEAPATDTSETDGTSDTTTDGQ